MGGVINSTKKAWKDTTGNLKTAITNPKKLNFGDLMNASTFGGASVPMQAYHSLTKGDDPTPESPGGPAFNFDPEQAYADQQSILDLANRQYSDAQQFGVADQANREVARQKMADALIKQSQASFQQGLPETQEVLNSQHLLNGSGLGQELARQQGNIATDIANQVGVQGAGDLNRASDINFQALQGKQGQQAAALSRGFSLADFARQAQVAKAIGATSAPQMPSGKSTGISGGLAGAGTGATIGTGISPGYGTAIGALLGALGGYAGGSNINSKRGK